MGKNDALAQGARKANFAVGKSERDDAVVFNPGIVAPEDERDDSLPTVEVVEKPRKRFIPYGNVLLVRRTVAEQSFLAVGTSLEKDAPAEGTVLAAGPEAVSQVGEYVVFGKYSGAEFPLNGETLLLMEQTEIKGRLEPELTPGIRLSEMTPFIGKA